MPIRIRALSTSAGYLRNAPIEFADGLTCIIGARGTCKSTIVETIRFAFDCDADRVKNVLLADPQDGQNTESPSAQGLLRATLKDGLARCDIVQVDHTGDTKLTVERDIDSAPRVYREGIKELSDVSVLHSVEIYSQGDLQRIAECDELRLELIDRPNKAEIAALRKERAEHAEHLRELGQQIRAKRAEIEGRRSELHGVESLRAQLDQIRAERPSLSKELNAEHDAFLRRKAFAEHLQSAVQYRNDALVAILGTLATITRADGLSDEMQSAGVPEAEPIVKEIGLFAELAARIQIDVKKAQRADLRTVLDAVAKAIEEKNANYYRLRQDQQAVNESLKKEDALKKQVIHLEKLQGELERLTEEERKLTEDRKTRRARFQQLSDKIYALRLQQVEQVNSSHGTVVVLTLDQGAQSSLYGEQLSALLQGSRLRSQDEVAHDLAQKIRPADLIEIVEGAESQRLATLLNRDLGQMARLVAFLMDHVELYNLEGVVFDDRLEITFYDGDVPKPVSQLSRGQMATALLPLILREADYPLLFDQPEDDLDNRFIYTTLVERVRQLKTERQLIFVTHNANIPVLGDADKIIVMQMDNPTCAAEPVTGSVEEVKHHILTLLEGGADAFNRRHDKYGDLLKSS